MKSDGAQHRFFNAMVLMGGSLAVGCGGVEADRRARETGAPGAGGGGSLQGAGGSASTGSSGSPTFAAAGSVSLGSGGFGAGSGILVPSSGGAPGTGGYTTYPASGGGAPAFLDGGADACPPTQWDCSSGGVRCAGSSRGWDVPDNCRCDPRRPRASTHCPPGAAFVCRKGAQSSDDGSGFQELDFECYCVADATDCSVCDSVYQRQYSEASCDVRSYADGRMDILCGCAVIYLK